MNYDVAKKLEVPVPMTPSCEHFSDIGVLRQILQTAGIVITDARTSARRGDATARNNRLGSPSCVG